MAATLGKSKNYKRLFRLQGLRYLINDIWMYHYKTLRVLTIFREEHFVSYLPKLVMEKTLTDGLSLFSSKESFSAFEKEFIAHMEKAAQEYQKITKEKELAKDNLEMFFKLLCDFFPLYSKTEFFYTDKAYQELSRNDYPVLKKNLKRLYSRFAVAPEVLQQYSISEVLALFDGKRVGPELIQEREQAHLFVGDGTSIEVFQGQEAKTLISSFLEGEQSIGNEITGTVANKGSVRGKLEIKRLIQ